MAGKTDHDFLPTIQRVILSLFRALLLWSVVVILTIKILDTFFRTTLQRYSSLTLLFLVACISAIGVALNPGETFRPTKNSRSVSKWWTFGFILFGFLIMLYRMRQDGWIAMSVAFFLAVTMTIFVLLDTDGEET